MEGVELIKKSFIEGLSKLDVDSSDVNFSIDEDSIVTLTGHLDCWQKVVDVGHMAGKIDGVKNVVCDIKSPECKEEKSKDISKYKDLGVVDKADLVIIGGGVTGCAIARELSKYKLDILLLEKCEDVCCGTSKANNGMIHSGYDPKHGLLKARLNVEGNKMYTKWSEELGFKFDRTGSFVCGYDEDDLEIIKTFYENGKKNEVPGIEIIDGDKAREIEPNLADDVKYALWTPSAGYVEPYEVTLALAENAIDNGCRFRLNCEVLGMNIEDKKITEIITNQGIIKCCDVINAAGLYADEIAKMANDRFYTIHARRGALAIFDKENKDKLSTFVGMAPRNYTKGGGPQRTPDGTLLWGPSAKEVWDKTNLDVDKDDLEFIIAKAKKLVKNIDSNSLITYFSGNRAATYKEDFVIENSKKLSNFTHVAGIQSPGLASSPAIAKLTEELFLQRHKSLELKTNYNPIRKRQKPFRDCTNEERNELIKEDKAYANVICRCETVTEAEIVNAIHGKVPATTVDSIKRRTRAGMGRCQSGFCQSKVLKIIARELGISPLDVTLKGENSNILKKETRVGVFCEA